MRTVLSGAATLLLATLLSGGAGAVDIVKVGLGGSAVDASLYIAHDKGFFTAEGIDAQFIVFDSGAKEIAPLGTGELDVGSGAASVGLYNAIARGIGLRIVADKGHTAPGYFYQSVVIRKDLIDSGKFKSLADLKGLKIGFAAPGVTVLSVANEAAKAGGISYASIDPVFLSFPQQVTALENKALDGSIMPEPTATIVTTKGAGVRFMNTEDFYPHDEITMVFYGEKFASTNAALAVRFMRGYLRGVRAYNAALKGGKIAGPGADDIIGIMARNFHLDRTLIAQMYSPAVAPDGDINLASLEKDAAFFQAQGWLNAPADPRKIVDLSFARKASAELDAAAAKK
jgi:NitT/TauT family transport system substrate-binding protein